MLINLALCLDWLVLPAILGKYTTLPFLESMCRILRIIRPTPIFSGVQMLQTRRAHADAINAHSKCFLPLVDAVSSPKAHTANYSTATAASFQKQFKQFFKCDRFKTFFKMRNTLLLKRFVRQQKISEKSASNCLKSDNPSIVPSLSHAI